MWLIFVLNLMANNLMNAWLPMIVESSGHSAAQGAYAGSLYQLGGAIGGLCIGILIDRFGLKVLVAVFSLAVPVLAFTGTPGLSDFLLLAMAFFSGCVVTGMQSALNAGAGLIYPTALRANGVGYALGVGRVGSISGPLIGKSANEAGDAACDVLLRHRDRPAALRRLLRGLAETAATDAGRDGCRRGRDPARADEMIACAGLFPLLTTSG